jgi:hypothetical protein
MEANDNSATSIANRMEHDVPLILLATRCCCCKRQQADPSVGDDGGETALHHAIIALTDEVSNHAMLPKRHRHLVTAGVGAGAAMHTVATLARSTRNKHLEQQTSRQGGAAEDGGEDDVWGQQQLSAYEEVLINDLATVVGPAGAARVTDLIVKQPRWTVYVVPAPHADITHGRMDEPKLFLCLVTDLNAPAAAAAATADGGGGADAQLAAARAGKQLHSVGRRLEQFEDLHAKLIGASAAAAARSRTHHSPHRRLQELQAAVDALEKEKHSGGGFGGGGGQALSVASTAIAELSFPHGRGGHANHPWPAPRNINRAPAASAGGGGGEQAAAAAAAAAAALATATAAAALQADCRRVAASLEQWMNEALQTFVPLAPLSLFDDEEEEEEEEEEQEDKKTAAAGGGGGGGDPGEQLWRSFLLLPPSVEFYAHEMPPPLT